MPVYISSMTLDEHFAAMRECLDTTGEIRRKLLSDCMTQHMMLSYSIARKYHKRGVEDGPGIMWEALPLAVAEWSPDKGRAGTALTLVMCRLIRRMQQYGVYRGGVRVPPKKATTYGGVRLGLCNNVHSEALVSHWTEQNAEGEAPKAQRGWDILCRTTDQV